MSAPGSVPITWKRSQLGEALAAVQPILCPTEVSPPGISGPPADGAGEIGLQQWLFAGARRLGLDAQPVRGPAPRLLAELARGAPVLLLALSEGPRDELTGADATSAPATDDFSYLVVLASRKAADSVLDVLDVLAPGGRVRLPRAQVDGLLSRAGPDGPAQAAAFDRLAARLASGPAELTRIKRALAGTDRAGAQIAAGASGWVLHRLEPSFWSRLRAAGGTRLLAHTALGHAVQLALLVAPWGLVGRAALAGRIELGWMWGWALLVVTLVAIQIAAAWSAAQLALTVGGLTRERLLEGILRLEPEEVRARGVGSFLGTVLEADALANLARGVAPMALTAVGQLLISSVLIVTLAPGWLPSLVFLGWLAVVGTMAVRRHRSLRAWTDARLGLTEELVESMVGYRTLLAQQPAGLRHFGGGSALDDYDLRSRTLDQQGATLVAVAPRGYLVLGVMSLAPAFASGGPDPAALAGGLGAVLLAYGALRRVVATADGLSAAAVAWRGTRGLFAAARRPVADGGASLLVGSPDQPRITPAGPATTGFMLARDLTFRYPGRPEPAVRGCSFELRQGDRVWVKGPSGSGKSTLGALVTGMRQPTGGVLLLDGFDHHSIGAERWRQRAGAVPQYHENHVLSATLAFNLLMGRQWPPRPEDWRAAREVCEDLGLGDLIARMPAGFQQMVGDSGWQLSHGERSRLFIARSLLQPLRLRVLDESFAALDPETLEKVLACVLRRTDTLLVVSHG